MLFSKQSNVKKSKRYQVSLVANICVAVISIQGCSNKEDVNLSTLPNLSRVYSESCKSEYSRYGPGDKIQIDPLPSFDYLEKLPELYRAGVYSFKDTIFICTELSINSSKSAKLQNVSQLRLIAEHDTTAWALFPICSIENVIINVAVLKVFDIRLKFQGAYSIRPPDFGYPARLTLMNPEDYPQAKLIVNVEPTSKSFTNVSFSFSGKIAKDSIIYSHSERANESDVDWSIKPYFSSSLPIGKYSFRCQLSRATHDTILVSTIHDYIVEEGKDVVLNFNIDNFTTQAHY